MFFQSHQVNENRTVERNKATASPNTVLKNSISLSFRGAEGSEESRIVFIFRARFLAPLGMTRYWSVFQHPAKSHKIKSVLAKLGANSVALGIRKPPKAKPVISAWRQANSALALMERGGLQCRA